jgi:photosystem II stability/assembly factor-like uncharacterized protein
MADRRQSLNRSPQLSRWLPLIACLLASTAWGHGAAPQVKEIRWPAHGDGRIWLVDELGLLDQQDDGFYWLCDDTVSTLVGFDSAHSTDLSGDVWIVATRGGIFRTTDRGCSFMQVPGDLTQHVVVGLWAHPERPMEVLTTTQTLGIPNDVWRSTDGGQTWAAAGINASGRVRSLVRSAADPNVIFASHGDGVSRSSDGGATFQPVALGPPVEALPDELEVLPQEFRLLSGHPTDADVVFALIERFPASYLVRSADGGQSWQVIMPIEDAPESLAFEPNGQNALLANPFLGVFRSQDGGLNWEMVPSPGGLGCLTTGPNGAIWACGRGQPRPWVAASTTDLGASWTPLMQQYTELAGGWDCPAGSPTALACADRCQPADQECLDGLVDGGVEPDAGVADSGVDQGMPEPPAATGSSDDCRAAPGRSGTFWSCLVLVGYAARRRRL